MSEQWACGCPRWLVTHYGSCAVRRLDDRHRRHYHAGHYGLFSECVCAREYEKLRTPEGETTTLDAAWAEAEAALPEASRIGTLGRNGDEWLVSVWFSNGDDLCVAGPTPVLALRALVEELRGLGGQV